MRKVLLACALFLGCSSDPLPCGGGHGGEGGKGGGGSAPTCPNLECPLSPACLQDAPRQPPQACGAPCGVDSVCDGAGRCCKP